MKLARRVDKFLKSPRANGAEALTRTAMALYKRPLVRRAVTAAVPERAPEKWVFVVGCYNSGTTLLRDILSAHPDVAVLPKEGTQFTPELTRPEDKGWTRMWVRCEDYLSLPAERQPERARRVRRDWSPWWSRQAPVFLEKSIANLPRMAWLDANFDNAYFVGIVRNGYCAAEGIARRAVPRGDAARELGRDSYPVAMAGEQWVAANERMLDLGSQVKRFDLISYEALCADPVGTIERVLDAVGLRRTGTAAPTLSDGRLWLGGRGFDVQNMNARSLDRLSEDDRQALRSVAGATMEKFGYQP